MVSNLFQMKRRPPQPASEPVTGRDAGTDWTPPPDSRRRRRPARRRAATCQALSARFRPTATRRSISPAPSTRNMPTVMPPSARTWRSRQCCRQACWPIPARPASKPERKTESVLSVSSATPRYRCVACASAVGTILRARSCVCGRFGASGTDSPGADDRLASRLPSDRGRRRHSRSCRAASRSADAFRQIRSIASYARCLPTSRTPGKTNDVVWSSDTASRRAPA